MLRHIRAAVRRRLGEQVPQRQPTYEDMGDDFHRLRQQVAPYTMTSPERMYALHEAVRYISQASVTGDLVECGVWRGGSSMLSAVTLQPLGDLRNLWLYDTFDGMPAPTKLDRQWSGEAAADELARAPKEPAARTTWAYATLEDVRTNMQRTGYPTEKIHYVKGKVEDTIPAIMPAEIALLRLDTDWYESTRHELEHLWPRLQPGGVLIIDDYGHWEGARKAVDEFFGRQAATFLLHRVDYTGRVAIKCA